jgi:hypothetical protein
VLAWGDEASDSARPAELVVLAPPGGERLAASLVELLWRWDASGRPDDERLTIRAYPRGADQRRSSPRVAIEQRWTRFELSWD